jgi:hypothetical protein
MIKLAAIHLSSFDFDSCILPSGQGLSLQDIQKKQAALLTALGAQNAAFKVNIGMIGSNRQDKKRDDLNRMHCLSVATPEQLPKRSTCSYSAFHTLPALFEANQIQFDPALLADAYARQAHGTAYEQAMDDSLAAHTHHAEYVFDEYKCSLLYFQLHQAAMNARSCDFMIVDEVMDEAELLALRKRSNAAYVHCKKDKRLHYINTMEDRCEAVTLKGERALQSLIERYESAVIMQTRDCFNRENQFGFRLNDDDLATIANDTQDQHKHQAKNYPIYFDFYDDRNDILVTLQKFFANNPALLPSNVVLRLHQYDANDLSNTEYLLDMKPRIIQGTGAINPNPGATLRALAAKVVGFKTEDFDSESVDIKAMSTALLQQERQLELLQDHTVASSGAGDIDSQHGLIQDCSPLKNQAALLAYERGLTFSAAAQWSLFDKNKQYPPSEQRSAIAALTQCLNNEPGATLPPHLLPVLKHGRLGQLIKRLDIKIQDGWVQKTNDELERALVGYKTQRQERDVYDYMHPILRGHSKQDKFSAVDAILIATQPSAGQERARYIEVAEHHKAALTQGQLAGTLKQNKVQLSFVNDRSQALKCLSSSFINTKSRLQKIEKIQCLIDKAHLSPSKRAAGLVVAFALSTKSWFKKSKAFGDTSSMHRFCSNLLKPDAFSESIRQAVFKLAGLTDEQCEAMKNLARKPLDITDSFWDSTERRLASETLRQSLLKNMEAIYKEAQPVLGLQHHIYAESHEELNRNAGQNLGFR